YVRSALNLFRPRRSTRSWRGFSFWGPAFFRALGQVLRCVAGGGFVPRGRSLLILAGGRAAQRYEPAIEITIENSAPPFTEMNNGGACSFREVPLDAAAGQACSLCGLVESQNLHWCSLAGLNRDKRKHRKIRPPISAIPAVSLFGRITGRITRRTWPA